LVTCVPVCFLVKISPPVPTPASCRKASCSTHNAFLQLFLKGPSPCLFLSITGPSGPAPSISSDGSFSNGNGHSQYHPEFGSSPPIYVAPPPNPSQMYYQVCLFFSLSPPRFVPVNSLSHIPTPPILSFS
jgi:hypothetical protein